MKILYSSEEERKFPHRPKSVPMEWLSERMAQNNHCQTLDRLNQRGGLGPEEIVCNILQQDLRYQREITIEQAIQFINNKFE